MQGNKPVGMSDTKRFLDRGASKMPPEQHIRELVQNGFDAGANNIFVTYDKLARKSGAPLRLLVSDDGSGQTGEELVRFWSDLSSSGVVDPNNPYARFGLGAKVSLYFWTDVRVMSWKNGQGFQVVIKANAKGEPEMVMHRDEEGDPLGFAIPAPAEYKREFLPESASGTLVILEGRKGENDTYLGRDGQRDLKSYAQFLNGRYWEIPQGVSLWAWEFTDSKMDKTATQKKGQYSRIKGNKKVLRDAAVHYDTVRLGDATVHLFALRDGESEDRQRATIRQVSVMTGGETYEVITGKAPEYQKLKGFGFGFSKVAETLSLVIEADPVRLRGTQVASAGVYPDDQRTHLRYDVSTSVRNQELPWDAWGNEFHPKMPEYFQNLVERKTEETTVDFLSKEAILKLYEQAKSLFGGGAFRVSPGGRETVVPIPGSGGLPPTGGTGGGTGSGEPRTKGGGHGGGTGGGVVAIPATPGVPGRSAAEAALKLAPEFRTDGAALNFEGYPLDFSPTQNRITAAADSVVLVRVVDSLKKEYPKAARKAVQDAVLMALQIASVDQVMRARMLDKQLPGMFSTATERGAFAAVAMSEAVTEKARRALASKYK